MQITENFIFGNWQGALFKFWICMKKRKNKKKKTFSSKIDYKENYVFGNASFPCILES